MTASTSTSDQAAVADDRLLAPEFESGSEVNVPVPGFLGSYIDRHPSRSAWLSLIIALCAFLTIAYLLGRASLGFVHSSTKPATAVLSVTRPDVGTALVQQANTIGFVAAEDQLILSEGDEIRNLDPDFPITITFFSTTFRLQPNSTVLLQHVRVGRFALPSSPHPQVTLSLETGALQVAVPQAMARGDVVVKAMGTTTSFEQGEYEIALDNNKVEDANQCCMTEVVTVRGAAHFTAAGETRDVRSTERALAPMGSVPMPVRPPEELMVNSALQSDEHGNFKGWTVTRLAEGNAPLGAVTPLQDANGRGAHFARFASNLHGEVGLRQLLDLDVKSMVSLNLRIRYRLLAQGLTGGGRDGTEYPLIVRVSYIDETGGQIDWYHGFYMRGAIGQTRVSPQATGEVPVGIWQDYEGHLVDLSPRPVRLRSVEILGSGWDFTSEVQSISLTGT